MVVYVERVVVVILLLIFLHEVVPHSFVVVDQSDPHLVCHQKHETV